ncbi:hypothetical protein DFQ01_10554 [Paenibacillus cellulosilyticus]|uniref:Uncharacterized protein n=1 Tax=Paenibacillus cellulosilyticus TaxID=375489 RepID=A0A2V2YVR9_9BACL|nr:hypothetical protein [Paenibacillus cellulosilyticus]PWW05071.1 hypothetical protein DFQ01_10554 [Paenibacillus cellulosilyticus]QKS48625.1 hypothetical protein HUB94_30940 [Paenibacillus cellulosilyticus]
MISTGTFERQWMDDYLDLLNYARQIGDNAWQQEIINTMNDAKHRMEQESLERRREELWQQFDAINAKMLELYRQLRETENASIAERLSEEVWELKTRRIEIGRQLYAIR